MSFFTPFSDPKKYRQLILNDIVVPLSKTPYSGKAFLCVSFTRFCPVGCSFCFFSSSPAGKKKTIADALTEEGIEKFITFSNDANLGYLLVSGGGEPFLEVNHILKVVERVKSDKIVLVTSGNWAKSFSSTQTIVAKIYEALKKRGTPTELIVRLSVDLEHARGRLGLDPAYNLISLFEEKYLNDPDFKLQFHTIFDDPCVSNILTSLSDRISSVEDYKCQSDAETVLKVNPAEKIVTFLSGMVLKIGYAKVFHSNIKVDLSDSKVIERNLNVFQWDMSESEEHNPSIVTNLQGGKGLDFWVNFNGNVTTWGNQVPDNIYNIYEDNYQTVVENTFADPISLAYIEKGDIYRDKIINEVNPKAVIRAKATNIRDYTGAIICEEDKTRLYLSVRILQDYVTQGVVTMDQMENWPDSLRNLVLLGKEDLQKKYYASDYSIVDQYIEKEPFNKLEWLDFLELIRLCHYDISKKQIKKAIDYYNEHVNDLIEDISQEESKKTGFFQEERIISMKSSVMRKYQETELLQDKELVKASNL